MDGECPSAAHGTNRDPYGCYEREQRAERVAERVYDRQQAKRAEARAALRADLPEALRLALLDSDASYQEIADGLIDGVLAAYLR